MFWACSHNGIREMTDIVKFSEFLLINVLKQQGCYLDGSNGNYS